MTGNRIASYCGNCHAAYMRENRPKHSELKPEAKRKANIRATSREEEKQGRLERTRCAKCNSVYTERHHPSYDSAMNVIYLCRSCHLAEHS